ncbi:hypothetical protein GCK72_007639 [Caenorhabditis remanei]|uniref:BTB domain-containing protein n=1 Tax=Caenorhabditis remanei TaxID=31234 RepID=A0A6A5HHT5_CAERE|nr:hypothetical protein GCK72_007639 [Caenorhabditis remanei]KAF1767680.1 hypothetical protein GCK72_007639 [Caenorhabditis remanei]
MTVQLDIGGTIFRTARMTLTVKAQGSLLARVAENMNAAYLVFADRSPKHFELILSFIRYGSDIDLPDSEEELEEIKNDAKFYELYYLVEKCDEKLSIIEANKPKLSVINSEKELNQKIACLGRPMIVIRFNSKHWGEVFHSTDALTLVNQYKSVFDIHFMPLAHDATYFRFSIHDNTLTKFATISHARFFKMPKVEFDIGGTIFRTDKITLMEKASGSRLAAETQKQNDGYPIFFDRSPTQFQFILNYIHTDGLIDLPESERELKEISREANYYRFPLLVEKCEDKLWIIDANRPILQVIQNENELVQKLACPRKPVVVIWYNMRNWGKVFHSINAAEFVEKNKHAFDIYFTALPKNKIHWRSSIHDKTIRDFATLSEDNNNKIFIGSLQFRMISFLYRKGPLTDKNQ